MDSVNEGRSGALVIGAWIDIEADAFRARITRTDPFKSSGQIVSYADTPASVTKIVEDWLDLIVS